MLVPPVKREFYINNLPLEREKLQITNGAQKWNKSSSSYFVSALTFDVARELICCLKTSHSISQTQQRGKFVAFKGIAKSFHLCRTQRCGITIMEKIVKYLLNCKIIHSMYF